MESNDIGQRVESLEYHIDELETALEHYTKSASLAAASKLPLLDRAKVNVLTVYAIESILFSYIRLNGANAKEHPVFRELTRVKQYFEKIRGAEEPTTATTAPRLRVDKKAANRFIQNALAAPATHSVDSPEPSSNSIDMSSQKSDLKRKATAIVTSSPGNPQPRNPIQKANGESTVNHSESEPKKRKKKSKKV